MTTVNTLTPFEGVYDRPESLVALDAYVAQQVMGLRVFPSWNSRAGHEAKAADVVYPYAVFDRVSAKETAEGIRIYGTDYCDGTFWFPSRVIGHAWALVEKLNHQGWRMSLSHEGGLSDQWVASFERYHDNDEEEFTGDALSATAPLAICLAALKAVDA